MDGSVPNLLAAAPRARGTRLTSTNRPDDRKEASPGAVGAGAHPGTPGTPPIPDHEGKRT
jgi:hypothetical protein